MLRSVQIKIILVFTVVGIIAISALGWAYISKLQGLTEQITTNQIDSSQELNEIVSVQIQQIGVLMIYEIGIFCLISILVGAFLSKVVVAPINKLIKNTKMIAAGEPVEIEYSKDGKNKNEVDDLVQAFSMMTTELKENLNEVSRQKKQIETILLHLTDGIIAFSMDGNVIHKNPAAKRFLNLQDSDDTFDKIFKRLHVDINMEKIIYLENWTSSEQKINVMDKYMNLFFAPFKDENDRAGGVIVVIQDITEHVRLDNMRKEFVADVSHELKTPITSIMGYADTLLESEYDKETQEKFLNVIATEARRMAKIVTDLLTLSKYDNNRIQNEETEFDLGDLVKKCQEKLQLEIDRKNHTVECFVTANVPPVFADQDDTERVVLNILTNSIKYTQEGGHIKIYVGFVYNDAYIKMIDNGIGIPEEDLTRIFERFYRVDKARTREMGGTGLGLSIAKEILDRNRGSIDIKSAVGQGTEVVIRLSTKPSIK